MAQKETPHINQGHRARLRERFLAVGPDGLQDDEVIELLLFLSIPRGDVKSLAKRLWKQYKNFQTLCSRPKEELLRFEGMGQSSVATLKIIHTLALKLEHENISQKPILNNIKSLVYYSRLKIANPDIEHCLLFLLDAESRMIHEEVHQIGTTDHLAIYPREITKLALNHNAFGLILVHNHPTAEATPSEADIHVTHHLHQCLDPLNINLIDHLILGQNGSYSFKESGRL